MSAAASTPVASARGIAALMAPQSVAIIGASADPTRIGGRPIATMLRAGFKGRIYPVNPNRAEIQGIKAYASVADLPAVPDAAIVAVPGRQAIDAIAALGQRGTAAAVVFSSGFAEVGTDGAALQEELLATARRYGLRLLGPNCLGVFNATIGWYPIFSTAFDGGWPRAGRTAVISQSGAFGSYLVSLARERGLGTPIGITTGNEADLTVGDAIAWCVDSPDVDVIMAYAEGIKSSATFVAALAAARRARKPVIVMKVGTSELGHGAAQSHTASVAGDDAVTDAVLAEFGALRVTSAEQLLDFAEAATRGIFPANNSLGVLTISGGVGVQISDAAESLGLPMPAMPQASQDKLKALLPYSAPRNPVDCTAQAVNDPALLQQFGQEILRAGGYSSVLAFFAQLTSARGIGDKLLADMTAMAAGHADTLFAVVGMMKPEQKQQWQEAGFLVYEDAARATAALAAMGRLGAAFARAEAAIPAALALPVLPAESPSEAGAKTLLAAAGLPFAPEQVCTSADAAVQAAENFAYPVVLKIVSPDIAHKTEMGGVLLNVGNAAAVREGFATLMARAKEKAPNARLEGVLVAKQMTGGVECIVGVHRDPVFGPVAAIGLGGIFVEVLRDVVLRRCPFNETEAETMIGQLRAAAVLQGARGKPPADIKALAQMLAKVSQFAHAAGDRLQGIDLNPVLVLPQGQGAYALDALVQLDSAKE